MLLSKTKIVMKILSLIEEFRIHSKMIQSKKRKKKRHLHMSKTGKFQKLLRKFNKYQTGKKESILMMLINKVSSSQILSILIEYMRLALSKLDNLEKILES